MKPLDYQRLVWDGTNGLTTAQRTICAYLLYRTIIGKDRHGWIAVTQEEIAHRCGMSRDTAIKHLHTLAATGWIIAHKQVRGGRWIATRYRIANPYRAEKPDMDHVEKTDTDHVGELGQATTGQSDNAIAIEGVTAAAPSGGGHNHNHTPTAATPDNTPTNVTPLLDQLGIIRRRKARA